MEKYSVSLLYTKQMKFPGDNISQFRTLRAVVLTSHSKEAALEKAKAGFEPEMADYDLALKVVLRVD
jgi:hypothetical protein